MVRDRIIALRLQLTAQGLDASPITIAWHLDREGHRAPSTSTIRRILHTAGLVTPQPCKRPRSSYRRFEAAQPNECWQSDFTHWRLADGTDIEILNSLDDHSRYLLACTAHHPVTRDIVAKNFLATADQHGLPAATLTDNGRVYTARLGGGRTPSSTCWPSSCIHQKNGHPSHPQTQGKVERFHQTLKRWLAQQPPAPTLPDPATPARHSSASSTTNNAPTARSIDAPPPGLPSPPQGHRHRAPAHPATTGSATTCSTTRQDEQPPRRPDASPRRSATPTPANASWPSPTTPPSP